MADAFANFLTSLVQNGWRMGVPIALAGAAIWILAVLSVPPFDQLDPAYLQIAATAAVIGLATTITSVAVGAVTLLHRGFSRRARRKAQAKADEESVRVAVSSLSEEEAEALCHALESGLEGFDVGDFSLWDKLLHKGLFRPVRSTARGTLCILHPVLKEHRSEITPALREALNRNKGKETYD